MELKQAYKIREKSFKRRWKIRETKAHDYATEDILSNFKRVSLLLEILGVDTNSPDGVAIVYIILKLDRLCNLLYRRIGTPENESLQDTIDDLLNYVELLEEVLIDEGRIK